MVMWLLERVENNAIRLVNWCWFRLVAAWHWAARHRAAWLRISRAAVDVGTLVYFVILTFVAVVLGWSALWTYFTTHGADRGLP